MRQDPALDLADARAISEAALAWAEALGGGVSVAVVDGGGQLLLTLRLDGASVVSAEAALAKARLAALSGKSSGSFEEAINASRPALAQLSPALSQPAAAMTGALPLIATNRCIGAIGVSGRTPGEDAAIAAAGVAAFDRRYARFQGPRVLSFGFTCRDAAASADLFVRSLGFEALSDEQHSPGAYGRLLGLPQSWLRRIVLGIGEERLELLQVLDPGPDQRAARTLQADSRSCDLWFQHLCLVVSDMAKARATIQPLLADGVLTAISQGPQTLPQNNPSAAGIVAFKFRDPDGHALELLHFPPNRGAARWQTPAGRDALHLGIDHSAIAISDPTQSGRFYGGLLGLSLQPPGLNRGLEQDRLDGLKDTAVGIHPYRCAQGPGLEGLAYRTPNLGRPIPADRGSQDLSHWQTRLLVDDLERILQLLPAYGGQVLGEMVHLNPEEAEAFGFRRGVSVLDPDRHVLQLVEA
ncbi:MAG: hypothetical protein RLZZ11_1261 [Cyanobacteriota bacterium]|jgi:uncharacterized protein GlcG (DUF336 family)/catechol 2,3-dioxygenase-like lactoylglutathione lyase family enzyme